MVMRKHDNVALYVYYLSCHCVRAMQWIYRAQTNWLQLISGYSLANNASSSEYEIVIVCFLTKEEQKKKAFYSP